MVRNRRVDEDEDDDVDLVSSHKEEKGSGRKVNPLRSKHSETEQRRRLKINDRFQVLMDLIPQNDQKRDKASFLLEVIQYIQFLQAKLDMYEGWSEEPSKLAPRRNSVGPLESFIDQAELLRTGSAQEENYIDTPSMLINSQNSVDSEIGEAMGYKMLDHSTLPVNDAIPIHEVSQSSVLGNVPCEPRRASRSESQLWQTRPCTSESDLQSYTLNEEELRSYSGEACNSSAYSQRLLNNLTQALQSSGVDLTQTSVSVQLDVGKQGDTGVPSAMLSEKDHENQCRGNQTRTTYGVGSICEPYDRAAKRPRP